jgi:O-antigen ligase
MQKLINIFFYLFAASLFIGIAPTNIAFYVLMLLFIIKVIKEKKNPFPDKYLNSIVFIYMAGIIILDAIHLDLAITHAGLSKLIKIFLIFFIIYLIKDKKVLLNGLWVFVITGILSALFSIISLFTQWEFLSRLIEVRWRAVYIVGFAGEHWIRYANKLSFALIFLICYWFKILFDKNKSICFKIFSFLGIIILIAGIFYSGSRGVVIGLFSGSLVLLFFKKYRVVPIILVILGLIFFHISYKTSLNIQKRVENFSSDMAGRINPWMEIIKKRDKFLIGYGTDNFIPAMKKTDLIDKIQTDSYNIKYHAHNNIIEFLVAYGYLGVILFFYFWLSIIIYLIKNYNQNKQKLFQYRWLFIASFWTIATFHINGITEPTWVLATTTYTICFILAILFSRINCIYKNFKNVKN